MKYSESMNKRVVRDEIGEALERYVKIYKDYGVIGLHSDMRVHMNKGAFLNLFDKWSVIIRNDDEYNYEFQRRLDGIIYFCLSETEEA